MANALFDNYSEPLIGLHHVTEYMVRDAPCYWCSVCEMSCGAGVRDVIGHVSGRKHRMNYIGMNYLSYMEVIDSSPMTERDILLLEYSRIIEAAEGRSKIKTKNHSVYGDDGRPATVSTRGSESRNESENVRNLPELKPEICSFPNSSIGCVLHNIALRSGAKNTTDLLHKLAQTLITNEEEMAKTLEVTNVLTRSILEYRLATSSPK